MTTSSTNDAPPTSSTSAKKETNNNNNNNNKSLLPSWTPIATRLLSGRTADATSWYVMDQIMPGGDREDDFVAHLKQELTSSGLLKRMTVAKTQGERQTNDIMALLQTNGLLLDSFNNANYKDSTSSSSSIRGDKSTFVGRDLVQQSNFPLEFPHLQRLIRIFQDTAQVRLSHAMVFDFALTSVQIAEFPGDGTSGYRRHCDRRGNLCRQEQTATTTNTSERLLTGVYYLTPDDWDHKKDGGCLRLFGDDEGGDVNQHVDVAPYRNRMIVFRADGVEHQVMPSHQRSRLALTIWLYGKIRDDGADGESSPTNTEQTEMKNILKSNGKEKENESNGHRNSHHPSSTLGPPPLSIRQVTDAPTNDNTNSPNSLPTIFVSIAAYRDSETGATLRHLQAMATHPVRVFVGLVLQLDTAADQYILQGLPSHDAWYQTNVRCLQLEARHAMGPCYARALGQSLCRGEDYVLQIDSHMRFRKHWDTYLIQELEQLISDKENDKVMLTAYPVGYHLPNQIPKETRGTVLVPWKFDDNGLLRQRGRLFECGKTAEQQKQQPIPCLLYAAGFNFSRSAVIQDCPYDEQLHHLFFGEELSMAVRLYTHGYDLYAPVESVCYHLWSRAHRPTHTSSNSAASQNNSTSPMKDRGRQWHEQRKKASLNVVRRQLTAGIDHDAATVEGYRGLGSVRTVQQFADSLGVDFAKGVLFNAGAPGFLPDLEYVQDSTLTQTLAPESLKGQIHALDAKSKNLIAAFL